MRAKTTEPQFNVTTWHNLKENNRQKDAPKSNPLYMMSTFETCKVNTWDRKSFSEVLINL